ncbi:MAG TPA: hypothetical protein VLL08_12140 [Kineosporiaceae bacterium]|nr:hypothetical protein [Kineosporiaceae bacterium]
MTFVKTLKAFAGFIAVVLLCAGCAGPFDSFQACPGTVKQQKRGLATVEAELPAGTRITKAMLNECDDGGPPSFTVYVTGKNDPVAEMLKNDPSWSRIPDEENDPNRLRGTGIKRPFEGATLAVGSGPFTEEDQKTQPEPGVYWYLNVGVR